MRQLGRNGETIFIAPCDIRQETVIFATLTIKTTNILELMRTSTLDYSDITVRMPQGADPKPLKAFAEAMGWRFVLQTSGTERRKATTQTGTGQPSKRLCGLFKMPADFDYKAELRQALKEKYEL